MPARPHPPATRGSGFRRRLPLLALLLALLVTGVGAFQAQRAHRSHRDTAEALLRDYGTFAAWSFSQRAGEALHGAVYSSLYPVRGDLLGGSLECLEDVLASSQQRGDSCGCGTPLGGRFAFHAPIGAGAGPPTFVGAAPPPRERASLVAAVERDARDWSDAGSYRVLELPGAGEPRLLAYARLGNDTGDTAIVAVDVDVARVREELRRTLDHPDLLPGSLTRGAPNDSLLAVQVLTPGGQILFASGETEMPAIHADQALPRRLSGAVVRAAVLPDAAEQLIIGGLPADRTPGLLFVFGLAAALMVLSVSLLRRESELARMRSDFVASASHELRTPLAQIRLFVDTLRLGRARTEVERSWALQRIDREALRLTALVDKILHFNRVDRAAVPDEREPVDVADEVEDAAASFEALLAPGQATLALDLPRGLTAPVHPDSFRQVLLNLLENAAKYGPPGQTIRVRLRRRGATIRLAVEDQGPGIPEAERGVVWEPFRRGTAAVGSVAVGGGIGLSVVREIVRAHDGRAWVEDAASGGARFVVELPAASEAADRGERVASDSAGAAVEPARPRRSAGPVGPTVAAGRGAGADVA